MARVRKTPQDWIDAGLKALRSDGPSGLQAETLARHIGATKGSFYWHFKDVPAFQSAALADWQTGTLARFEKLLQREDNELAQLRALAGYHLNPLDRAVRGWAAQNAAAAKSVKAVDGAMLARIGELLEAQGATHPDFPGLIHAALICAPAKGSHAETLIDLLLVLK